MKKRWKKILLSLLGVILLPIAIWIVVINLPQSDLVSSTIASPAMPTEVEVAEQESVNAEVSNDTENSGVGEEKMELEKPKLPFEIGVVYSPRYLISIGGLEKMHPFDIKKYDKIHKALLAEELLTREQTLIPAELPREDLLLVHSEDYLDSLKKRSKIAQYIEAPVLKYAPVSLDRAVLKPFRIASGGTVMAARQALVSGIGINIGGGYHHAKPDLGEGFCVYADVPIAIRKLQQEGLIKRAVVIDVDVHQGNGTVLCLDDEDTFTFSMHQGDIYPVPKEVGDLDVELDAGLGDDEYLEILDEHLESVLEQAGADICFVVGGCDTLEGDPLASLNMTHEGIAIRDQKIIDACVARNIPVVLTLSGGYSKDAWRSQFGSIKNLITKYGLESLDSRREE